MLRRLRAYFKSEQAAVLPMMAMMFPILIAMAGLGVDVSHWMMMKRKLQIATDAAAMAGGFEIANSRGETAATSAATLQAQENGWTSTGGGTLTVSYASDAVGTTVTVNATQKAYMWFSDLFLSGTVYVSTVAASYVETSYGPYCILTLGPTSHDAVSLDGTVTVDAAGCGVADNSTATDSFHINGNVFVNVGNVHLAGGTELVGGSYVFNYTGLQTNASTTTDPYADISVPVVSVPVYSNQTSTSTLTSAGNSTTCTDDQLKSSNANKWTATPPPLQPGRYCGGINVSGGGTSIVMTPGVYIMDGGSFNMSGSGSVTCPTCVNGAGVTIIMTKTNTTSNNSVYGAMNISGAGAVDLVAPKESPTGYTGYEGIAVYQDRNCSIAGATCTGNVVTGTSTLQVSGTLYTPKANFKFGGTSDSGNAVCTHLIADTVSFNGTPDIGNSCTDNGSKGIGTPQVTLVL
ncbi:MAG: pilus assembly protein [Alphaproteobacteria bacterium]|nr:MAG: pilus assembly protein [Alphaproteobacteria bacterium]